LKTLEYWRTKINKKSKYFWENDHAHSGYAYNRMDSWKGEQLSFLFDFIDREFEFDSKSICLDIGCNSALNLKYFKEKYYNKDNEYYGFDLNETALNNARENIPEGSFKKCNFLIENPIKDFKDNFFDICFSTWVLSHINDSEERKDLIENMIRVSKKGIIFEAYKAPGETIEPGDPDEFNVVVKDDYLRYSSHVKLATEIQKQNKSSRLFYWDKTK